MKKFVHSRWKDCPGTSFGDEDQMHDCSIIRKLAEKSVAMSVPQFSSSSERPMLSAGLFQYRAPLLGDSLSGRLGSYAPNGDSSGVIKKRSEARTKDDKSAVFTRPNLTYGELIRNVYNREGRTVMRLCDIIKCLKASYPYFCTLRRLDSCVGQALHKSKRFERISPGKWKMLSKHHHKELSKQRVNEQKKCSSNDMHPKQRLSSSNLGRQVGSRRLRRQRKRPDFLNIEWNRSGKRLIGEAPINEEDEGLGISRFNEDNDALKCSKEPADSDTSFTSEFEVHSSNTSPGLPTLVETNVEHVDVEDLKVKGLKEVIKEYNDDILKKALEKLTQENEKYLQRMTSALCDMKKQCDQFNGNESEKKTMKVFQNDFTKHNHSVIEGVINQIISQNQKCLEALSAESEALKEKTRSRRTILPHNVDKEAVKTSGRDSRFKSFSLPESQDDKLGRVVYKSPLIPVVISKSFTSHINQIKVTSNTLRYSLPVISKSNNRQSNHVRLGKRVYPRLKTSLQTLPVTKEENDFDGTEPRSKNAFEFPVTSSFKQHSTGTRSPTGTSSVRKLFNNETSESSPDQEPMESDVNGAESRMSVDTAFAEFVRNNTELDDIVALIDPSLASSKKKKPKHVENGRNLSVEKSNHCSSNRQHCDEETMTKQRVMSAACASLSSPPKNKPSNSSRQNGDDASHDIVSGSGSSSALTFTDVSPSVPKTGNVISKTKVGEVQRASQSASEPFVKLTPKPINMKHPNKPDASVNLSSRTMWRSCKVGNPPAEQPASSYVREHAGKPLNFRYVPPYRWGVQNVATRTRVLQTRPSMLIAPRYVMYSPVRSAFGRLASPMDPFTNQGNRRASTIQHFQLSKPDVRCRIRGAHVFRFPVNT